MSVYAADTKSSTMIEDDTSILYSLGIVIKSAFDLPMSCGDGKFFNLFDILWAPYFRDRVGPLIPVLI